MFPIIPLTTRFQGDPNASIPTVQPIIGRPMFAAHVPSSKVLFLSQAAVAAGVPGEYALRSRVEPVRGCRDVSKRDMRLNDAMPAIKVDPESYSVRADGEPCTAAPAETLPLSQAYYVY